MAVRLFLFIFPALAAAATPGAPTIGRCFVFPNNNVWNTPVDELPLDKNSAMYIQTIGPDKPLHPDFGPTAQQGIPFVTVPGSQPPVPVDFGSSTESDPGPYPFPADAPIEAGSDGHVLVIDRDRCILYETFASTLQPDGSWKVKSAATFDLKSNALRPAGWTSADAAGLPIFAGLVRWEEIAAGEIRHALRITVPQTRNGYIWPARHRASTLTGTQYPPMGQRFRLKASVDISKFLPENQVILAAMKRYGVILADNGSAWFFQGAPDPHWMMSGCTNW